MTSLSLLCVCGTCGVPMHTYMHKRPETTRGHQKGPELELQGCEQWVLGTLLPTLQQL